MSQKPSYVPALIPDDGRTPSESRGDGSRDSRRRRKPTRALLNVGFVCLMLGLISFAVYQCARHLTTGLNTLRTQEITDTVYADLTLYLFRDEAAVSPQNGNLFLYAVRDGEKVPTGKTLGSIYVATDADTLQDQLDRYGDRLQRLESGRFGGLTGATDALATAETQYRVALAASAAGRPEAASLAEEELLAALNAYYAALGGTDMTVSADSLRREQAALVAGLPQVGSLTAERAGWFFYDSDGLEAYFASPRVNTMTIEDFRALTAYADGVRDADLGAAAAGKLVYSSLTYAATCLSAEDASRFAVGTRYRALCGDAAGSELTLTCVRNEAFGDEALVVFSTQDAPELLLTARSLTVEAVLETVSGYRVPTSALVNLESPATGEPVTGVYVLSGNRVIFRRVAVRAERDGYVILRTVDEVQAVLEDPDTDPAWVAGIKADGWSFLSLNDRVITGGRNLYEGKVIS